MTAKFVSLLGTLLACLWHIVNYQVNLERLVVFDKNVPAPSLFNLVIDEAMECALGDLQYVGVELASEKLWLRSRRRRLVFSDLRRMRNMH